MAVVCRQHVTANHGPAYRLLRDVCIGFGWYPAVLCISNNNTTIHSEMIPTMECIASVIYRSNNMIPARREIANDFAITFA